MSGGREAIREFDCFGSSCAVLVSGEGPAGSAEEAAEALRLTLLDWHERFSRFLAGSELTRLNLDPRERVPASPVMLRFARAVVTAGEMSCGLVDATLVQQIQDAGYTGDLSGGLPLESALRLVPARAPASAAHRQSWREIVVDEGDGSITRPPGVMLDSGGIGKGLFADVAGEMLAGYECFAVNCAGDLLLGGTGGSKRQIHVESPFESGRLHTFLSAATGVATSGIGRRSWLDGSGSPAHHLLDPATGRPAFTGVVQVTALDPQALIAEVRAKAAILSGPAAAASWLRHGGVIVLDDGSHQVIEPPPVLTLSQLSGFAQRPRTHAGQHA